VKVLRKVGDLVIEERGAQCVIGVPGAGAPRVVRSAQELREVVRSDDRGRYRPLSGAGTLPAGWEAHCHNDLPLEQVLEVVYPLARTHQRQLAAGTLELCSLDDVLRRQSGRYESSATLSQVGRALAVETVCGVCVRRPVWHGAACGPADIPCPEPCSVMVAFCREAALWEAEPPACSEPDPAVAFAAFEEPGNELREHYLSRSAS
jgi:hypothetical protein